MTAEELEAAAKRLVQTTTAAAAARRLGSTTEVRGTAGRARVADLLDHAIRTAEAGARAAHRAAS